MSRLRELVKEFCPDGVEYESFLDVIERNREKGRWFPDITRVYSVTNQHGVIASDEYDRRDVASNDTSNYGVIRGGMFAYNPSRIDVGSIGMLAVGSEPGLVSPIYVVFSIIDDRLDLRYVEYFISSSFARNVIKGRLEVGARNRFDFNNWSFLRIPVPPIEIQREIVRILDSFQELDDALTAEIEAREKQLAWYRAKVYISTAYPMKKLGDIGTFERGRRFTRTEMGGDKTPCIHYGDIYTRCDFFAEEPLDRLVVEKPNLRYAHAGDVVIAATSENAEDVCKAIVWLGDEDAAVHDDCQILHHEQNPYYLSFFFNSEPFMSAKMKFVTESKVVRISGNEMAQIELPIPPVDVQNDIAEALLTFVRHTEAIAAELDIRRKQFEHYRDKLLSFPEKEA